MTPALPPGFQLEGQSSASPPLPPGFQLEGSPPAQPSAPAAAPQSLGDQLSAGFTRGLDALPFGDKVLQGAEQLKGLVQGRTYQDVHASDETQAQANPVASTVGTVSGAVLPFVAGGEIPAVAKVLGMDSAMPMLSRILLGGTTQAALSGADTLERTGDLGQAAQSAGIGAVTGGLAAPVAEGASKLIGMGAKTVGDTLSHIFNPAEAAQTLVGKVAARDAAAGKAMTPVDEATAQVNNQPVINADRFGTGVRQLARTAANSDPAAREVLGDAVGDRFATQGQRAQDFVRRITGGNVNDLALQDSITTAARRSNDAAYGRAYADPGAQSVWTPGIKQLFQSPDFVNAVKGAERTAANDAAANGTKAVRSPFVFDAKGNIQVRRMPDGSVAKPNLPFWDVVQRNLRTASEEAYSGGKKLLGGQLKDMRTQLVNQLDSAVPSFQQARQGASAAFGAEDAIDAGRKFVMQKTAIPEARRAYAKFTPPERKAFGTGFASELIDKIGAVSDRVNVINQVFGNQAAREQVHLALGKNAADQLEHFVRLEDIMQMTKQEVSGNSTTVRQLLASGALGGIGTGLATGGVNPLNWNLGAVASGAALLAAGRMGARAIGQKIDQQVLKRVADMLANNDPQAMQRSLKSAAWSPAFSASIKAIEHGLSAITRGAATAIKSPPIDITIRGGAQPALPAPG